MKNDETKSWKDNSSNKTSPPSEQVEIAETSPVVRLLLELIDEGKLDFLASRLFVQHTAFERKNTDLLKLSEHLTAAADLMRKMRKRQGEADNGKEAKPQEH